jgi:peptidoglycan hydrolase-like protein with peptidoglycan-binding domain
MRFIQAAALLSVLCAFAGVAATTPTRSTAAKKATARRVTAKKATKKTISSAKSKVAKSKSTKKAVPAATWRTRQQNPTPERYKEIQQALADKGYLKGEPSGVWDAASVDAMQRFQSDQKLTATGKINAPSLIGLGLGAKSAGAEEAAPLTPAPSPAPSQPEPH